MSSSSGNPKTLVEQQQSLHQHHMPLLTNQRFASALVSNTNPLTATLINKSSKKSTSNPTNNAFKTSNGLLTQQSPFEAISLDRNPHIDLKCSVLASHTSKTNLNPSSVQAATGFATARLVDLGKRLLEAARAGHTDHVHHLVVNSGAPFTSDWLGTTALHLAAQNGHHEIVEILLKGGVNREARTKLERTALHAAAQGGWLKVVELLISHGCEVNPRDMLKMTPLHWAAEREHAEVAKRLLLAGADIHIKSKFQLSPLDLAQASTSLELKQVFKNCLGKNESLSFYEDFTSSFYGSNDIVEANIDCLLPHLDDEDSHSPLHQHYPHHHQHLNNNNNNRTSAILGMTGEQCFDLVELEWNNLRLESFLTTTTGAALVTDEDDGAEPRVEYLMKVVKELKKENQQLRQRVELLTTTTGTKRR